MTAPLKTPVVWRKTADAFRPWVAFVDGHLWVLWLGEFPEEPLYTLIIDGAVTESLDDWPACWTQES